MLKERVNALGNQIGFDEFLKVPQLKEENAALRKEIAQLRAQLAQEPAPPPPPPPAHDEEPGDELLPKSKAKSGFKGVYPTGKRFHCRITKENESNKDPFEGQTFKTAVEAARALRDWKAEQHD